MLHLKVKRGNAMLEKDVEAAFVKNVKKKGGMAYKFVSPNHRSVPDRLVLMPVPPELVEVVGQYVKFIEIKAPGKKPRPAQVREINRLKALGFYAFSWDGIECL